MDSSSALKVVRQIKEMQELSGRLRLQKKRVAFVPTMGYLHGGHSSLIERVHSLADVTVISIFVNPLQFGPNEDYTRYPRDLDHDLKIAEEAGADIVFYPDAGEMFPKDFESFIDVKGPSGILEGAFRPGHFRGVATVVIKLFNIVKPHVAVFGQKDIQQAFIIKKLVGDLGYDIEILVSPIVRESDGLALSSRNVYLNPQERAAAPVLYRTLCYASEAVKNGQVSVLVLKEEMRKMIMSASPSQVDYIAFIDPSDFSETENLKSPEVIAAVAVRFGKTRLIDNFIIPVPDKK
jgi:pantoate--beta-alanine ligase